MTAFNLLSEPIRKYVRDKGWERLRPIQEAAIQRILSTENNYVLISRTASGKTEAAFLPILSRTDFREEGVKVLYISPLIALINDQFRRVEELCEYLDISVTKWHGEASKSQKDKLLKNPNGIVLITPESLEAMFVNKPYNVKHLFASLEYVVIDEVHSFLGSDRGVQLQSILSRLQKINKTRFKTIALSATVSDSNQYLELKSFLGDVESTKIIRDTNPKPINAVFRYFEGSGAELPLELLKDLYIQTRNSKSLIFPNARGRVEEVAVKLRKISDKVGGHQNYFSHHSSVDKEVREYVEFFAKNNIYENFSIACTSTLELGIDIGSVDQVVQIDATHSIASLIQRVGRSGRRDDKASNLFLYATNRWTLLQSVACWLLYDEKYIEPVSLNEKPYDILLHQMLSIIKGSSGMSKENLLSELHHNFAFKNISENEIEEIIEFLVEKDFLEQLGPELILGIEGEKIVNNREFYSVFQTENLFKVSHKGNKVGEIPLTLQIREDENIYLSARIWKIIAIDLKSKKIEVIPAKDGKKPVFEGNGANIADKIREKMLEVLVSKKEYDFLDEPSQDVMSEMQKEFSIFDFADIFKERPLLSTNKNLTFYSFTGTKINRTLKLIFDILGIQNIYSDLDSSFEIKTSQEEFILKLKSIESSNINFDFILENLLENTPEILDFSKYGMFLPLKFQIETLKNSYYDFPKSKEFLKHLEIITN
ncbi:MULTISPECIES: DEAD/DEAH box helicase [Elizabethkingia]|uniref:DEAD/DEAH box helicase n=1 Tax=Elizabethkingia meningoseptica TaxID=238 RepID=A0A1V3TZJ6_ELIME|nr:MULTISPECIES: DEAD/DEAH box helicase [Elizabethkingia]MBG0512165.1 DEAD/DEAH box helicase [Elizabethkingia meningoseptica]MDE5435941.1 DEAD/DEAH box helicase [Elizabethkingia meningoseptica]MDX8575665.1 DEAD/DEAH box helicase [Elizabethkingia sp. HX WYD]OOH95249.1 DEAD/DEAH box helicase [Elizabethkingia meningoseptica]HAY3553686.1 DEAD/DEAH box helicase [Elizabethkingia meningoseptica]